MLKRHFTVIYGQLDELKERVTKLESTIAETFLRIEGLNRKFNQIDSNRAQQAELDKMTRELATAISELRRDINALRARFETELLSLGDPITSKEKPSPQPQALPQPATQPPVQSAVEPTAEPTAESTAEQAAEEIGVHEEHPETPEAESQPSPSETPEPAAGSSDTEKGEKPAETGEGSTNEPTVKSLEEQLGLTPSSENSDAQAKEGKPEEKKKRRWL